ncbi:hypothetical protein COU15_03280 [Candidatus Kaiserbacteria bacterium CG10_big_fil_rev_8_21_14_0_10_45_20]|uniref:Carbohydrate kinase PfkB domain-containing protein n=1 Tax=Candidatus Kaiserbacteria bacterium CG10_big_fil_rev_8_21_14_0_10_45_20 TaxID=1974607 RepID=A0A2H0UEU7_9BACT|nr:MAG: hypothetical protein COU15_03280 [Candidatus Kaiserbacteria bacterium CG10_big_fil_rev_8_21_14_0_10_45_20]
MSNIDFIAIGDTVTDAFITLQDARVHCDLDDENCRISMRWGDKIPYQDLAITPGVGNSANAAVSAARLGLSTALITDIGNDQFGKEIIDVFKKESLDSTHVRVHNDIPTNYHFVLSYEAERTILIKHQEYPYVFPTNLEPPKTLYFSSVGEGTETYHEAIADYGEAHPDILFAFQPGTFQMKLGTERLARIYARANMVFANKEEYQRILCSKSTEVEALLNEMRALGPDIPILTDGRDGAYALTEDGIEHVPMFPDPAPPKERTGAGDAFSSTTAALVTQGYSLKDAMERGTVNSAYVVQKIGAQEGLLSKEKIEEYLANAPAEYQAEKL